MSGPDSAAPSFSPARRWAAGFSVGVAVTAAFALLVMVNYLSARHYLRGQWTDRDELRLSRQTVRVLRLLTNEVRVTLFFDTRGSPELHQLCAALLKEYNYINPRVVFRTVDPVRDPANAELVLAAHKLTALKHRNFVILECEGRSRVIYENELSDYDVSAVLAGQEREFRRANFKGELLFTTAIFNLANPRQFKVAFLQGHGEHDPERSTHPHGYARFAAVLEERNAPWEKLFLLGTNDVPADCHLLIIAGPRQAFLESELARIETYLRRGGRALVLLANPALGMATGLPELLAQWGVGIGERAVLDPPYSPTGNDLLTAQINNQHPIMRALLSDSQDLRVRLVLPRSVGARPGAPTGPDAPRLDVLAATSDKGVEVEVREGVAYPTSPLTARPQVWPLMVAVEQGSIRGVTRERGATRIVVLGDSLCLDNELIDSAGNRYFAALAVDWLLDRPEVLLEGLLPRPLKEYRLVLTRHQLRTIQWLLLAALPGGILLVGGLVWWRRRR